MLFLAWWQWLEWAESTHDSRHTNATHVYMRLSDQPLLDDLTLFLPEQPSLIVKDLRKQSGIHCRFGVKRTIVDAHFDTARNMVAQVRLYMWNFMEAEYGVVSFVGQASSPVVYILRDARVSSLSTSCAQPF